MTPKQGTALTHQAGAYTMREIGDVFGVQVQLGDSSKITTFALSDLFSYITNSFDPFSRSSFVRHVEAVIIGITAPQPPRDLLRRAVSLRFARDELRELRLARQANFFNRLARPHVAWSAEVARLIY